MRRFVHAFMLALPILAVLSFAACDDDDPVKPKPEPDYFPYVRNAVWTYKTNVYTNEIGPDVTLQVKIDTVMTSNGVFDFLKVRVPDLSAEWVETFAVMDSAGVVYGIGDHPREPAFQLFKHKYAENEITRETITVQGKSYQTVKYRMDLPGAGTVYWWFADGVGLVREHSLDGISLFNDSMEGEEVLTELVSYVK